MLDTTALGPGQHGRRQRLARVAAVALVAATAGTGAGGPARARPVRSIAEFRDEQVVRQHWDLTCGAAAIATVFTYQLGRSVSEREVALAMLRRTSPTVVRMRLGFSLLDLKVYAASHGVAAAGFGGMTLEDLDARAPVIVPLRWHGFRHFVVYRGRLGDRVLIADPSFGNRTLKDQAFTASWANGIGFVVFDPSNPRAPNRMGAPGELFQTPGHQAERTAISNIQVRDGP